MYGNYKCNLFYERHFTLRHNSLVHRLRRHLIGDFFFATTYDESSPVIILISKQGILDKYTLYT